MIAQESGALAGWLTGVLIGAAILVAGVWAVLQ
jgi:hypothetical protein